MAPLVKHLKTDTWAYYSPFAEVTEKAYVTKDERKLYVGGPGVKAKYKIGPIVAGTPITVDGKETNHDLKYFRIFKFSDLAAFVPAFVTAFLKEKYPGAPEEWQLWIDESGCVAPVPEPEPEPMPEPMGREWTYVVTIREMVKK